jgi:signal transduction histidine kinase
MSASDLALASPTTVNPTKQLPPADLYIWDFWPEDGSAPWKQCDPSSHHLLLVDSANPAKIDPPGSGIVLINKQVTSSALAALLGLFWGNKRYPGFVLKEEVKEIKDFDQERQWSDYLAKAVHDFRAPLTAASGYCGLLLAGEMGPLTERQQEILGRTQNSLARLARMTSETLSRAPRSRINDKELSGKISNVTKAGSVSMRLPRLEPGERPHLEPGEIDQCIQQAIHEIRLAACERKIRVRGEVTPPGRTVRFDAGQIEQVLLNLLDNACKFTPAGGRIEVAAYPYGSRLFRVDVFNTGPAISSEWLERVFDEYTSLNNEAAGGERSDTQPGLGPSLGLGLAISKRIIEQHEGRIWVENRPEGPCISFVLPIERSTGGLLNSLQNNERYEQNGTR